jgi:hypothetical protein
MTALMESPALLLVVVLALCCGCLVVLSWGRKLPRQGDWLVGLGLLGLLIGSVISGIRFSEHGFVPETWGRGWIWPHDEVGAITVGVLNDALGVAVAMLCALVAALGLIGSGGPGHAPRAGRSYAALGLGAGGVALAWYALTPWLALTGTAITLFGGFLALGRQWDTPGEAQIAMRFGYERSWGLLLSLFGLYVLAGEHAPLSLLRSAGAWSTPTTPSVFLGAGLLFFGAFVQLQPFPILGWVMKPSETPSPARIMVSQVFSAWAVLALLVRLEPQFREEGLFPDLGWLGLASSALAALAGLLNTQWRLSLGAWLSSGFSLAVAALAFSGPSAAFSIAIGAGLGAAALAAFGAALESGGTVSHAGKQRAIWAKVGCGIAAAAGTGFAGFISAGGLVRAGSLVWSQPALVGAGAVVLFVLVFLGWNVARQAISAFKDSTQASWVAVLAPYGLIVLSLGVIWSGTLSGGLIPGDPDRVFHSLFSLFFGPAGEAWGDEAAIAPASGLYWMIQLLAAGAALMTAGRNPDFWPGVARKLPRFSAFVESGYGVDALFERVLLGLTWTGNVSVRYFDRSRWGSWLSGLLGRGAHRGATFVAIADLKLSRGLGEAVRGWVEAPAKALQLIQNGDVQWYLIFAVGSGVAILAYFMKT